MVGENAGLVKLWDAGAFPTGMVELVCWSGAIPAFSLNYHGILAVCDSGTEFGLSPIQPRGDETYTTQSISSHYGVDFELL